MNEYVSLPGTLIGKLANFLSGSDTGQEEDDSNLNYPFGTGEGSGYHGNYPNDAAMDGPDLGYGTWQCWKVLRTDVAGQNPYVVGMAPHMEMAIAMCEEYEDDANKLLGGRYHYEVIMEEMPERRRSAVDRRAIY